ncbi:diaminopimelate epimerase [Pseudarcicella hirudinis]|uniref:diaminopimelate epimerase n=1 Tax=Pseudarcicella hirudinis TaxID=1079859 RepID=UPI0035ED48AB
MKFYKYQGAGNDFVVIDDRSSAFPVSQELIASLCHRRFGIGADGVMLLQNASGYDFRMVYFNADGTEGTMCGNGGRCLVRFAHDLGVIGHKTTFIAIDGEHEALVSPQSISLKMIDVSSVDQTAAYDFMNTGSPHYVAYVENLEKYDVVKEGKAIRYGEPFVSRGGTNVNLWKFWEITVLPYAPMKEAWKTKLTPAEQELLPALCLRIYDTDLKIL